MQLYIPPIEPVCQEFTNDLPGLIMKGGEYREKLLKNPEEAKQQVKELIMGRMFERTMGDFLVNLSLGMLRACSLCESVPSIICRILINNLGMMIQSKEIILTEEHQKWGLEILPDLRTDFIMEAVNKLGLTDQVDQNYFLNMAKVNLEKGKFVDAANIIQRFNFYLQFDIQTMKLIVEKLVAG